MNKEYKFDRFKGITLISLVITIVILIILASVGIYLSLGNNGIFTRAKQAKTLYENSKQKEEEELNELYGQLLMASDGTINNISLEKLQTIIQNEVNKAVTSSTGNPTGTIIAYSVDNVPTGYLKCEGQEVSRVDYKNLFDIIGTTYGEGDGETTFNVPDLRGEFLRGTGTATRNTGTGEKVGIHQEATKHPIVGTNSGYIGGYGGAGGLGANISRGQDMSGGSSVGFCISYSVDKNAAYINKPTWLTSRPTNTAVLYCIKY